MRFPSNVSQTNSNNLSTEQTVQLPNTILQLSICDVEEGMAPTPKEAADQDPSRLEHFACKFYRQRTPVASRTTQRRPGAGINTPLRWRIVTEYQKLLGDRSRVLPGGLKSLQLVFPWKNQVQQTRNPETRAESTCIAPSSLCSSLSQSFTMWRPTNQEHRRDHQEVDRYKQPPLRSTFRRQPDWKTEAQKE